VCVLFAGAVLTFYVADLILLHCVLYEYSTDMLLLTRVVRKILHYLHYMSLIFLLARLSSAHFTNWAVKIAQSVNWCRPCTRNYFSCIHKLTKFAQFVNWANFQLPNSGNRQAVCQVHELGIGTGLFHELGNETVQFTKWAVSQIGRNTDTFYFAMKQQ